MNAAVAEEELVAVVELLGFVAELCQRQPQLITAACTKLVGVRCVDAAALAAELVASADLLAQAMGFRDHTLEPAR
jgi:hypothetical protein